jgi:hypothetical protein
MNEDFQRAKLQGTLGAHFAYITKRSSRKISRGSFPLQIEFHCANFRFLKRNFK